MTAHGVGDEIVVRMTADHERILSLLATVVDLFGWSCLAYCLMSTHYHLIVGTTQPALSRGMHRLNG